MPAATLRSPLVRLIICSYYRLVGGARAVIKTVDPILGMMAAVATALSVGLIARDGVGMPPDMVREDALIAASILVAAVVGIF
jgi:hypothetical protein